MSALEDAKADLESNLLAKYDDIADDAKKGIWTTKDGKEIHIRDMSDSHIKNTISYLEKRDKIDLYLPWITRFTEELERRKNEKSKIFTKGQVIIAKDEFIEDYEEPKDTIGIVIDYIPDQDYLVLGVLHPEDYGIAPTFSTRGEYYRLLSNLEKEQFGIKETFKSPKPVKESEQSYDIIDEIRETPYKDWDER